MAMRLHFRYFYLAVFAVAASAHAQQAPVAMDPAACTATLAATEQAMQTARARGQMLRRQQLATELAALRAQCEPHVAQPSRAEHIAQLEQEIQDLRTHLARAEQQLRALKAEAP